MNLEFTESIVLSRKRSEFETDYSTESLLEENTEKEEKVKSRNNLSRVIKFGVVSLITIFILVIVLSLTLSMCSSSHDKPEDLVESLPRIGKIPFPMYSGYISVSSLFESKLFYLFAGSKRDPLNDPVIIWLNGGPGTSSLFGCFQENGPYLVNDTGEFSVNEFSWNNRANIIYWDQPVGTGYSYTNNINGYARDEETMANHLYSGMLGFYELHPEYRNLEVYIAGESYAAKQALYLSYWMLQNSSIHSINIKGVLIGNGFIDSIQASAYYPYLVSHNLIASNDTETLEFNRNSLTLLQQYVAARDWINAASIDSVLFTNLTEIAGVDDSYDIRYSTDPTEKPYFSGLLPYLQDPDTQKALHVSGRNFSEGNTVYDMLSWDEEQSVLSVLQLLLNWPTQSFRVLFYNGECDPLMNFIGTFNVLSSVVWPGAQEFVSSPKHNWTLAQKQVGWFQKSKTLVFAVIYNAGHMSPFDQPAATYDMLTKFLNAQY